MKNLIFIFSFVFFVSSGFAQSTIRFSLGYGLPLNSDLIMEEYRESRSGNSAQVKGIYGSLGSGLTVNAAFGHSLGKSPFGWDLESTFLLGKKYKSHSVSYTPNEDVYMTYNSICFYITPSLTYHGSWKKLTPYMRIGPTFGLNKIFVDVTTEEIYLVEYRYQYQGGISVGLKTAIGASLEMSRAASFFWEISITSMSYAPKEGWLSKYDVGGESQLAYFTDEERTIKLKDEYKISADQDETIQTAGRYSMGAIALNLGFKFTLGLPSSYVQP